VGGVAVMRWHLITGEYPPTPGGVSDYTRQLAIALVSHGQRVEVWAPRASGAEPTDAGIEIHRLESFGARGLAALGARIDSLGSHQRLFLQYVPQAFGAHGMNVRLVRWLSQCSSELWVQFHEVALVWDCLARPQHQVIAAVQTWMAGELARRADRIFVSIEGWRKRLGGLGARADWLPIPSNVPVVVPELDVSRARMELGPGPWVGHFGAYGALITRDLAPALREIADRNFSVRFLLLGRGAKRFGQDLGLGDRVKSLEDIPAASVSAHLSACDLLVQPFPDGISSRRTSAMAGLALGRPMVSTEGHLTDSVWLASGAVALAPAGDVAMIAGQVLDLLKAPERSKALGERGARIYRERFSLERTLETLGVGPGAKVKQPT
jgi:glycosyltransferase involved in cell wall biosynthesis